VIDAAAGGGFQVVVADLRDASGAFGREAGEFQAIMPESGPACPDSGDGALNQILGVTLDGVGLLHMLFAGVVDDHAGKLDTAAMKYADNEVSLAQVCTQLTGNVGPGADR
jgi:Family of unknown function (DUF6317)